MQLTHSISGSSAGNIFERKTNLALSLYKMFLEVEQNPKIQAQTNTTYEIAKGVLTVAKKEQKNFSYDEMTHLPYEFANIKEKIGDLPHILTSEEKFSYVATIIDKKIRFLFIQRKDQTNDVYEVSPHLRMLSTSELPTFENVRGYVVFLTFHNSITQSVKEFQGKRYFNYLQAFPRKIDLKEARKTAAAPFHHEVQVEGKCGLHALNAYLGGDYLSEAQVGNRLGFSKKLGEEKKDGMDGLWITDLKTILDEFVVKPRRGSNEKLHENTSPKEWHEIIAKGNVERESFLARLRRFDRLILGVQDGCPHALAFRKDSNDKWWRIESKNQAQEEYGTDEEFYAKFLVQYKDKHWDILMPLEELVYNMDL